MQLVPLEVFMQGLVYTLTRYLHLRYLKSDIYMFDLSSSSLLTPLFLVVGVVFFVPWCRWVLCIKKSPLAPSTSQTKHAVQQGKFC